MAIPEGLTIMPEELNLPEQTPGLSEPPISSVAESLSIKDRVRKYLTPAVAVLGMATGIVYSGNQETVHAAPVADSDDSSTGDFKPVDTVLFPLVGVNMVDAHRPVAPAVTVEPSPKASVTVEPPVTATPGASNTPEIPTATATAIGIPTERPTPTEQGPLKEARLPQGASVGIPAGPSSADMPHFKNGDRDSGAAAVGLNFATLKNP